MNATIEELEHRRDHLQSRLEEVEHERDAIQFKLDLIEKILLERGGNDDARCALRRVGSNSTVAVISQTLAPNSL